MFSIFYEDTKDIVEIKKSLRGVIKKSLEQKLLASLTHLQVGLIPDEFGLYMRNPLQNFTEFLDMVYHKCLILLS